MQPGTAALYSFAWFSHLQLLPGRLADVLDHARWQHGVELPVLLAQQHTVVNRVRAPLAVGPAVQPIEADEAASIRVALRDRQQLSYTAYLLRAQTAA